MSKELNTLKGEGEVSPEGLVCYPEAAVALPLDSVLSALTGLAATEHDRRTFLKLASVPCVSACLSSCVGSWPRFVRDAVPASADDSQFIVEAQFYEKLPYKKIRCKLCPRECVIDDRERGYCGVRENHGGSYYTLVHSRVCAAHIDPIE